MAFADYEFYTNTYGGTAVGAADFPRLAMAATQYVNVATMGRAAAAVGDKAEAVKIAMCAVVDVMHDESTINASAFADEPALASETNGSWSRTYSTRSVSGTEVELLAQRKRDALLLWLGGTGLLGAIGYCAPKRGRCG